jgi:nitrogen regulatory protein PII
MNDVTNKKTILKLLFALFGIVIVLTGAYFLLNYFSKTSGLSKDFTDARMMVSATSQDIVRLSNETNDKIKELSSLDARGKYERGQSLIDEARAKNKESYEKAVILSKELEKLTRSLNDLGNPSAERIMYQGVSLQISLVTEFIQYTKDLNSFLEVVEQNMSNNLPESQFRIAASERQVNERITTINQLNETFKQNTDAFEQAIK